MASFSGTKPLGDEVDIEQEQKLEQTSGEEEEEEEEEDDDDEEDLDEEETSSRHSTIQSSSSSKGEEEEDPDALSTLQVIMSVVLLCLFSFSFATSFFLLSAAIGSVSANFTDRNYTCAIANVAAVANISCLGTGEKSPCINVILKCEGFNETKIMYEFYQDYFDSAKCTTTRCYEPDRIYTDQAKEEGIKYPLSLLTKCCIANVTEDRKKVAFPATTKEWDLYENVTFIVGDTFQHDVNKPDAMFYRKSNPGTGSVLLSRPVSYIIIVVPQVVMVAIAVFVTTMFLTNRLSAKEIYRPVTPITPLHVQVNGKWYIKEVTQEKPKQLNAFEKLRQAKVEQA